VLKKTPPGPKTALSEGSSHFVTSSLSGQAIDPGKSEPQTDGGGITVKVERPDDGRGKGKGKEVVSQPRNWDQKSSASDMGPEVTQKELW
jgi:hypothetical protein